MAMEESRFLATRRPGFSDLSERRARDKGSVTAPRGTCDCSSVGSKERRKRDPPLRLTSRLRREWGLSSISLTELPRRSLPYPTEVLARPTRDDVRGSNVDFLALFGVVSCSSSPSSSSSSSLLYETSDRAWRRDVVPSDVAEVEGEIGDARLDTVERDRAIRSRSRDDDEDGVMRAARADEMDADGECRNSDGSAGRSRSVREGDAVPFASGANVEGDRTDSLASA